MLLLLLQCVRKLQGWSAKCGVRRLWPLHVELMQLCLLLQEHLVPPLLHQLLLLLQLLLELLLWLLMWQLLLWLLMWQLLLWLLMWQLLRQLLRLLGHTRLCA